MAKAAPEAEAEAASDPLVDATPEAKAAPDSSAKAILEAQAAPEPVAEATNVKAGACPKAVVEAIPAKAEAISEPVAGLAPEEPQAAPEIQPGAASKSVMQTVPEAETGSTEAKGISEAETTATPAVAEGTVVAAEAAPVEAEAVPVEVEGVPGEAEAVPEAIPSWGDSVTAAVAPPLSAASPQCSRPLAPGHPHQRRFSNQAAALERLIARTSSLLLPIPALKLWIYWTSELCLYLTLSVLLQW